MTTELKPCPFCGGAAQVDKVAEMKGGFSYHPGCDICDFSLEARAYEAEAIAAWNQRTSPTAYPTEDAYQRACRALHWRTAELRAHGIEPITLADDAPHYPPEDYPFRTSPPALDNAALAEEVLKAFNGGLVDVPDAGNARGFTTRYEPLEAVEKALAPILTRREEQAWQEGAKAALDAAAKVARGWTGGPPDMGTKEACLIETGIHTIDPSSLRKDR